MKLYKLIIVSSIIIFTIILSNRIAALGERLNSYCSPNITDNQVNNIKYICSVKGLVSDYFGPIYLINQMPSNDSPIILSNKPIGPNGKGGVILEKEGQSSHIVVVDSEGNRTHRDFSPISGVSSSSNIETPSLTLIGDAGKSEVSIDTRGFNSSSQSGDALFIGDANNIKINVSGKDGSNGRSVERVLALSVLKGDLLGVSELARSLVDKFKSPLSETEITEPEISKEELSKSLSGISNCDDDSLLGSELSDKPGVFKVSTKKARVATAERAICKRMTNEELTAQVMCVRKEQRDNELFCDYNSIIKPTHMFKRRSEVVQSELTCSEPVADGKWTVRCSKDYSAVLSSAIKPYYISLKPNDDIKNAMEVEVEDSSSEDKYANDCLLKFTYNDIYYDYNSIFTSELFSDTTFYGENNVNNNPISNGCVQKKSTNKFDYLTATGSLVSRIDLSKGFPGTKKEYDLIIKDGVNLHEIIDSNYGVGIDKLSYWSFHEGNQNKSIKRSIYDLKNTEEGKISANVTELIYSENLKSIEELGFNKPTIGDGLIGYKTIDVKLESEEGYTLENAIKSIFGDSYSNNGIFSNDFDSNFLDDKKIKGFKFKNKLTYTFDGLSSGYMLKKKINNNDLSPLRVINNNASFKKRIIFIPGKNFLDINKEYKLCDEINIVENGRNSENNRLLNSDDIKNEMYNFILPVPYRGIAANTFDTYVDGFLDPKDPGLIEWGEASGGKLLAPFHGMHYAWGEKSFDGERDKSEGDKKYPTINRDLAPSNKFGHLSHAFMINRKNTFECKDSSKVSVENSLNSYEKKILDYYSNFGSVLIGASGKSIYVFFSNFKVPKSDDDRIIIGQTLNPYMYLPKVSIGPMKAIYSNLSVFNNAGGFHGINLTNSSIEDNAYKIIDKIKDFSSSNSSSNEVRNLSTSLGIDYDKSVELYIIPPHIKFNSNSLYESIKSDYLLDSNIDKSGGRYKITTDSLISKFTDNCSSDCIKNEPRFIKVLNGFKLNLDSSKNNTSSFKENLIYSDNISTANNFFNSRVILSPFAPNDDNIGKIIGHKSANSVVDCSNVNGIAVNYPSQLISKTFAYKNNPDIINYSDRMNIFNLNANQYFKDFSSISAVSKSDSFYPYFMEPNFLIQDKNYFYANMVSNYNRYLNNSKRDRLHLNFKEIFYTNNFIKNGDVYFNKTPYIYQPKDVFESIDLISDINNGTSDKFINYINSLDVKGLNSWYLYDVYIPWTDRINPNMNIGIASDDKKRRIISDNNYSYLSLKLSDNYNDKIDANNSVDSLGVVNNFYDRGFFITNLASNLNLFPYNTYKSDTGYDYISFDESKFSIGEMGESDKDINPTDFYLPGYVGVESSVDFYRLTTMSNDVCYTPIIGYGVEQGIHGIQEAWAVGCSNPANPINYISNRFGFFSGPFTDSLSKNNKKMSLFGSVRSYNQSSSDFTTQKNNVEDSIVEGNVVYRNIDGYLPEPENQNSELCSFMVGSNSIPSVESNTNDVEGIMFRVGLPNGFAEDNSGGLYYGPLSSKFFKMNSENGISLASEDSSPGKLFPLSSRKNVINSDKVNIQIMLDEKKSLEITEGLTGMTTIFNGSDKLKLITIRRLIKSSYHNFDRKNNDTSKVLAGNIFASSPELLAAYFLHSSISAVSPSTYKTVNGTTPELLGNKLANSTNNTLIWKPNQSSDDSNFIASNKIGDEDLFNKIFSEKSGFFIRDDQQTVINELGFTLNKISIGKTSLSKSNSNLIIQPFILSTTSDENFEKNGNRVRLAWELDEHSIHSYVVSANEADASSVNNQSSTIKSIPGTGLVVSFADKLFGSDSDSISIKNNDGSSINISRSEGLARSELWSKKIVPFFREPTIGIDCSIYSSDEQACSNKSPYCSWSKTNSSCNQIDDESSLGDFSSSLNRPFVAAYVNPKYDYEGSSNYFVFSEAVCSGNRKSFLSFNVVGGTFYSFKIGDISPFKDACTKSAFYSKKIDDNGYFKQSIKEDNNSESFENNVYWIYSKLDSSSLESNSILTSDGYNNRPYCQSPSKEISAQFVSNSPKKMVKFSPSRQWKTKELIEGSNISVKNNFIEAVRDSSGEYKCPKMVDFYKFLYPEDNSDCSDTSSKCYLYSFDSNKNSLNETLNPVIVNYKNIFSSNNYCYNKVNGSQIEDRRKEGLLYNENYDKCVSISNQQACSSNSECSWNISNSSCSFNGTLWIPTKISGTNITDSYSSCSIDNQANHGNYLPSYITSSVGWVLNDGKFIQPISNNDINYNIYNGYYFDKNNGIITEFEGKTPGSNSCNKLYINVNGDGQPDQSEPANKSNYLVLDPIESSISNRKFGNNDKYMVLTEPKQIIINSGNTVNLSGDEAYSAFTGGSDPSLACAPSVDKESIPVLRSGVGSAIPEEYSCPSGGTDCYDTPIGIRWLSGSSTNLVKEQPTPWSTERLDGNNADAPSCDIFNDVGINQLNICLNLNESECKGLASECGWDNGSNGGAPFCKKLSGVMSQSSLIVDESNIVSSCLNIKNQIECENIPNNKCLWSTLTNSCSRTFSLGDSRFSVNDPAVGNDNSKFSVFYRGGRWVQVGTEKQTINTINNPANIDCEIYLDSSKGSDSCNGNVKLYYQTVDGTTYNVLGENGENGGHAGSAVVLTTHKPEYVSIESNPGKGGLKTSVINDGISSSGGVCYKRSKINNQTCGNKNKNECDIANTIGCAWNSTLSKCEAFDLFDPSITIIKSKKTIINVIEGSDGKNGSGKNDNEVGWGVMPGAINWISEELKKQDKK